MRAVLLEIDEGRSIESSRAQWRDDCLTVLTEAVHKTGAPFTDAEALVEAFLARLDVRFERFEKALWAWAHGKLSYAPLYLPRVGSDFVRLCKQLLALGKEGAA